ncbi:MAG: aminotransferase class V-fold PLP-dependent enzyme [Deferribacteres bacterium]|nr:aminotransferase class V-fold PLP-dependent enzyme [Deferribacteres bacterium]
MEGGREDIIYLDNAATSFPKPKEVVEKAFEFITRSGANPGRAGHRLSVEASRILFECRKALSEMLDVEREERLIFTKNATEGLNVVAYGLLKDKKGNVVTTSLEHNSVMRPLRLISQNNPIEIRVAKAQRSGRLEPEKIEALIDEETVAVFVNHASNVTGTTLPIFEIAQITEKRGIPLVVDLTQSMGCMPLSFKGLSFTIPVFTGHKSLLGFPGTGGFYLPEAVEIEPLIVGGTGSNSENQWQPDFMPDKFESGTPNTVGIASLLAGVNWIKKKGVESIRKHEIELAKCFTELVDKHPQIEVYGHRDWPEKVAVVSVNVKDKDPAVVSLLLDREFGILTRAGLHCAPIAHETIGTFPTGAVRFAFGVFNSLKDAEYAAKALIKVAEGGVSYDS